MTEKLFKVQIYQVEVPEDSRAKQLSFADAIAKVKRLSLAERERHIGPKDRRLEAISQEGENTLMNFTTLTYHGPGRTKSGEESRSFELEDDEFYGNETTMLYDA